MKLFKKLALAAALSSFAMAASAMEQIQDTDLSQVSGQDGVSIAANLNVNIGSFVYTTNNNATGTLAGSIGFNNVNITGTIGATLDIVSGTSFNTSATQAGAYAAAAAAYAAGTGSAAAVATAYSAMGLSTTMLGLNGTTGTATQLATAGGANAAGSAASATIIGAFYNGSSDVVQIAIPEIGVNALNVKVGSITMGQNGAQVAGSPSFGSIAMNDIKLQGTTAFIWAH